GSHLIEVTAPGKKSWQTTAKVEGEKASVVVTIPALEDAPAQAQEQSRTTGESASLDLASAGKGGRTLGLIVGGVGIVGLGIGTAFALEARESNEQSLDHCDKI